MTRREAFLAGDRPGDVALFLADDFVDDPGAVADGDHAERLDGGALLVVDGDRGRQVFATATGMDAMQFAQRAGRTEGAIAHDLTGGECPVATGALDAPDVDADATHALQFVFAFVEAENEEAGGMYAEGAVVHAYAYCACGTAYSERWHAGE